VSVHLVACAARIQGISPAQKLLLLCLADDSRNDERHASPGRDVAVMWTGLSPSRVSEATKRLVELELIRQVRRGRRHVGTAVWQVFPHGCCEAHGLELQDPTVRSLTEQPESGRRPLSAAQLAARRANVERIAEGRRSARSASDAQAAEEPVDSPDLRMLSGSQHPKNGVSASDGSESTSDGSDTSQLQTSRAALEPTPASPASDVTPPAREAAKEHPMLANPESPHEEPGAYGREDWHPLACAEAIGQAVEQFGCSRARAEQLLEALGTDPKVDRPWFLTTRRGFDRATSLLFAINRDPEVTGDGHQLAGLMREQAAAAATDAQRHAAAEAYLDSLTPVDRAVALDGAEARARAHSGSTLSRLPRPLVLSSVARWLDERGLLEKYLSRAQESAA
jgi:hypothetical protein